MYDEKLFTEVEREECPICMLTLPLENNTKAFNPCCGKLICAGCIYAMSMSEGGALCAFCRTPPAENDKEYNERLMKLIDKGNAFAFYQLGGYYDQGIKGMPLDKRKANELWLKAGELGCADAYHNLGVHYNNDGKGVENDKKKAKQYYELAAMKGDVAARNNLGVMEGLAGNRNRSMKHMIIAARAGYKLSLDTVKGGFMKGIVITKDEYEKTLRAYHERQQEMKSDMRDKAVASDMFDYD